MESTRERRGICLQALADALDCKWVGDGETWIEDVASIEHAGPGDLTFVRSTQWAASLAASRAGAVIVPEQVDPGGRPAIVSPHPARDFARAVARLRARTRPLPGVHESAVVDETAQVDPSASLDAHVRVAAHARIGAGSILHPNVTVYADAIVGDDCELHAGVVVREDCQLGDRVVLQPGVVIGGDGFGYAPDADGVLHKVPQVGRVVIEDDVEIGANSTVDRATLDETRIRRGAKIDNLVQIAHNCDIGEDVIVAAQTGFSGSTTIGRGAIVMAQVGAAGHLRVGARAFVGARAGLHKDVEDGGRVFGAPQMEEKRWHRAMAALARLPDLLRRVRALEKRLGVRPGSATSSIEPVAGVDDYEPSAPSSPSANTNETNETNEPNEPNEPNTTNEPKRG